MSVLLLGNSPMYFKLSDSAVSMCYSLSAVVLMIWAVVRWCYFEESRAEKMCFGFGGKNMGMGLFKGPTKP